MCSAILHSGTFQWFLFGHNYARDSCEWPCTYSMLGHKLDIYLIFIKNCQTVLQSTETKYLRDGGGEEKGKGEGQRDRGEGERGGRKNKKKNKKEKEVLHDSLILQISKPK